MRLPDKPNQAATEGDSAVRQSPEGIFSLRTKLVAWWSMGVAAAALGGLVLVLITDDGDDLATVALILAIVAFGLQILFFALQLWVSAEQNRRGQELASATDAALKTIDERSQATVDVIKEQFAFVLRHALSGGRQLGSAAAVPGSSEASRVEDDADIAEAEIVGSEEDADALAEIKDRLDSITRSIQVPQEIIRQWDAIGTQGSDAESRQRSRIVRALTRWPDEQEGLASLERLKALSEPARKLLEALARRRVKLAGAGRSTYGLPATSPEEVIEELVGAGLVEKEDVRLASGQIRPMIDLTPEGRQVTQVVTATGPVPSWYLAEGSGAGRRK